MQIALVATWPDGHLFLRQDVDLQPGPASPVTQDFSTAKRAYFVSEGAGLSGYVAEIGASILGAHLNMPPHHIHDHASYIGHWMKLLADDKRAFLTAAAQAQTAVDWLLAKSPSPFKAEAAASIGLPGGGEEAAAAHHASARTA